MPRQRTSKTAMHRNYTELLNAVIKKDVHAVTEALKKPLDINRFDKHGWPLLVRAATEGDTEIVQLLLTRQDIDINLKNCNGSNALIQAAYNGDLHIVNLLLTEGEKLNRGIDIKLSVDSLTAKDWANQQLNHCLPNEKHKFQQIIKSLDDFEMLQGAKAIMAFINHHSLSEFEINVSATISRLASGSVTGVLRFSTGPAPENRQNREEVRERVLRSTRR